MIIDSTLLDTLSTQTKASLGFGRRLTCARLPRITPRGFSTDETARGELSLLRLSRVVTEEDEVNAMEPGTILPIHRHRGSTVVRQAHQPIVVVLRCCR